MNKFTDFLIALVCTPFMLFFVLVMCFGGFVSNRDCDLGLRVARAWWDCITFR